ncbi:MaoC family dehydratase [uncultured Sneathiella sp.]|jgi:acyl dehydratase|uniref:MaoC family dehydratase n=1 Tax=uncultured Sneathiella sp. TaxID=879315 RepID=UPI0030DB98C2|tara:strand:+ start:1878 stop:2327 length:450 start_codon:yes stop_codon:yes gene_type:complete
MSTIYFEDIAVGDRTASGSKSVTKEEIIEFARKYDPQPFHTDEDAAKDSIYGGLIASGWHTTAILMRLLVDNMTNKRAGLGSPGCDDLRWVRPVRPGDALRYESEVIETRKSESRPDMGIIRADVKLFNQNDEVVLTLKSIGMVKTRPA